MNTNKGNTLYFPNGTATTVEKVLTFNTYQEEALKTAAYPGIDSIGGAMYLALGLCGEAGEVAEKIKKYYRDGIPEGMDSDTWIELLAKEVGDVLWYGAVLLNSFGISLQDAAVMNLEKLADRKARGVLKGSGDTR